MITGIATDAAGDVYFGGATNTNLVLGQQGVFSIVEVAAGAAGTVTPLKTTTEPSGQTESFNSLRVDAAGNMAIQAIGLVGEPFS